MSVPVFKRNESTIEFLHTYHKLRKEVNILIARDFGIKPRTYTTHLVSKIYELSEEVARSQFESWRGSIVERYGEYKSIRSIDEYYNRHYGQRTN